MKVHELIRELNEFPMEMDVIVYADHGQVGIKATSVEETIVDKSELEKYTIENMYPLEDEDIVELERDEVVYVVKIEG